MGEEKSLCPGSGHLVNILQQCPECGLNLNSGVYAAEHYAYSEGSNESG